MVLFGASILYAGDGLSQAHLVSTTPSSNDDNVPPNTTLSFTFDSPIVENSIKPHTVTLKQKEPGKHKIKGNVSVTDENILIFAPQLEITGFYLELLLNLMALPSPFSLYSQNEFFLKGYKI